MNLDQERLSRENHARGNVMLEHLVISEMSFPIAAPEFSVFGTYGLIDCRGFNGLSLQVASYEIPFVDIMVNVRDEGRTVAFELES